MPKVIIALEFTMPAGCLISNNRRIEHGTAYVDGYLLNGYDTQT